MAVSVVDANPTRPNEKIPPLHRDMPPLPRLKGKIMIKKLDIGASEIEYIETLNALVDVVNEMASYVGRLGVEFIEPKIPSDIYAEQRNYDVFVKNRHLIGKLCKFKSGAGYTYGILTNIKRKPSQWAFESNGRAFSSCEPVKPTDSIIYKGSDNEK